MIYDLIIIGAGPAGLMAANVATKRKLNYLLIDSNPLVGKKLLITGATRCNVTNPFDVKEFINNLLKKNKRFLYSTLKSFGSIEVKNYFEEKGVPLVLENNVKYFPASSKSKDIQKALLSDLKNENIVLNTTITNIIKQDVFHISASRKLFKAKNVIIATGSKSYPQTGSTGAGAKFAKQLGHQVIDFYPAETSIKSGQISSAREYLQGISIADATLRIRGEKKQYTGDFIFTHFGLGGPVIQTASEYIYHALKENKNVIELSLTKRTETELRTLFNINTNTYIQKFLELILIKRLARYLMKYLKLKNIRVAELSKKQINQVIQTLRKFPVKVDQVEHRDKAFVNGGGVITDEINPKTMESKLVEGLYFAGETIDIHGPIGGYNITIALSTGFTAASNINKE